MLQSYYNHRHSNPITILKSLTKRRSFRSPIYHHDRNRLKSLSCCRNNSSRICKKIYIYRGIFKDYTILILWVYGQIILLRDHLDVSLPCSLQSCWVFQNICSSQIQGIIQNLGSVDPKNKFRR